MDAVNNSKRPIIVGIFIFLGLIILIATILTLGGQKKTFAKTFMVRANFNDVGGLLDGGNVWLSGVKVGTVKKISFYGDSQVQVIMNIDKNTRAYIPKDSKVKIGSDGLIGNKIIVIYGGDPKQEPVAAGGFLTVEKSQSTDDMLEMLQANNQNLLAITSDFKTITSKINSGSGLISSLINDPKMAQNMRLSLTNLQTMAGNLKTVSESSKLVTTNLATFTNKMNKDGNSINDFVSDTLTFKNLQATVNQLKETAVYINKFSSNLKNASDQLNQRDNAFGVLLNDTETANSLKITLKNMEAATKKLDEDLEALQHNFLFKRFFKNKEKLEQK